MGVKTGLQNDAAIVESGIMVPVDVQSRYQKTVQTHNAVSISATSWSNSNAWLDCSGFEKIAVTFKHEATISTTIEMQWSNDGATHHGRETSFTGTAIDGVAVVEVKARYFRISIRNGDAAAHTTSVWAYLRT
jgi:hypothetical protein